jgi:hypothetical protein
MKAVDIFIFIVNGLSLTLLIRSFLTLRKLHKPKAKEKNTDTYSYCLVCGVGHHAYFFSGNMEECPVHSPLCALNFYSLEENKNPHFATLQNNVTGVPTSVSVVGDGEILNTYPPNYMPM